MWKAINLVSKNLYCIVKVAQNVTEHILEAQNIHQCFGNQTQFGLNTNVVALFSALLCDILIFASHIWAKIKKRVQRSREQHQATPRT